MNVSIGNTCQLTARADGWAGFFRNDLLTFGAAFAALHAKRRGIPCSWVIAELRAVRDEEMRGILTMLNDAEREYAAQCEMAEHMNFVQ